MQRVPVLAPDKSPLMPMKASRARRFLKEGKAIVVHNDLKVFCIQPIAEPLARNTQNVVIGLDPGKLFAGIGVQSYKFTLFIAQPALPQERRYAERGDSCEFVES